jgi:hypothetical protein
MKKVIGIIFVTSFFVLAGTASAQTGMMGNSSETSVATSSNAALTTALQDIYQNQNINNQTQIDCSKVSDIQFKKLGDAYMGYGITEQQHTAMEQGMGGEGSANLQQVHINMGRAYLGCGSNYASGSMMGGYGPESGAPYGYMMEGIHGVFFLLVFILVLTDLVLAGIWLWKQIFKK